MVVQGSRRFSVEVSEIFWGTAVFLTVYVCVSMSGMLRPVPPGIMKILHAYPAIAAFCLLLVMSIFKTISIIRRTINSDSRTIDIMFYLGMILISAGVLISSQIRFEGRVLLTEGQSISGDAADYIDSSVYRGRSAGFPQLSIQMKEISPYFYRQGKKTYYLSAVMETVAAGLHSSLRTRSFIPSFSNGLFYTIKSFGYSPFYRIVNMEKRVFEEAFVMLKLFPPGTEDSFRTLELPHTFYVQYYPDATAIPAKEAGGISGPAFKLRVSRNMDLLFSNRMVLPGEQIDIGPVPGPMYLSLSEPRKWAEVEIVRDYGIFLMLPGCVMIAAWLAGCIAGRVSIAATLGMKGNNVD